MKKALFVVAVMLLSISTVSVAQVKFGVKAGVNFANVSGDDMDDMDSRIAPLFGGFANIGLTDKLAFQPELLYSMKGAKESGSMDGMDYDATVKLSYIDVPLMLKYNISGGLNIQAGPQLGLLMSADYEMEAGGESESMDIKDELKGMDLGFNLGAGYDFGSLGVDVRYNLGLSNIADSDDGDIKNNAIQIGVSYAF